MSDFIAPPGGKPRLLPVDRAQAAEIDAQALDKDGRVKVMPSLFWAATTVAERAAFGHRDGAYLLPTTELVGWLTDHLGGRDALEIGAGNGVLAAAAGIRATDSHQQLVPKWRAYYELIGSPIVPYGPHVERLDAAGAVSRYRPAVVVGSWITWRFNHRRPHLGGDAEGVDEAALLARVEEYIHIGNDHVHQAKPALDGDVECLRPPWLFSRAMNGSAEHIMIWSRRKG